MPSWRFEQDVLNEQKQTSLLYLFLLVLACLLIIVAILRCLWKPWGETIEPHVPKNMHRGVTLDKYISLEKHVSYPTSSTTTTLPNTSVFHRIARPFKSKPSKTKPRPADSDSD